MTLNMLYIYSYIAILALLTISMASTLISPDSKWLRTGAIIRMICPIAIIAAAGIPVAIEGVGASITYVEAMRYAVHGLFWATASGIAILIANHGGKKTWQRTWIFSPSSGVSSQSSENDSNSFNFFQHRRSGRWALGALLQIIGAALAILLVQSMPYATAFLPSLQWGLPTLYLAALVSVILFGLGRKVCLKARRLHAPIIHSPEEISPGSYVLYLRTFNDDKRRAEIEPASLDSLMRFPFGLFLTGSSEEEQLVEAVKPVGQTVAVGIPGEASPHAGAIRVYLPKRNWKQPVRKLIEGARLVVIQLGSSPGTVWEIAEAIRTLPPQRLLLIIPWEMSDEEYETIRKKVSRELQTQETSQRNGSWRAESPPSLPHRSSEDEAEIGFIRFSQDWDSHVVNDVAMHSLGIPWMNFFTTATNKIDTAFKELADYENHTGRHWG